MNTKLLIVGLFVGVSSIGCLKSPNSMYFFNVSARRYIEYSELYAHPNFDDRIVQMYALIEKRDVQKDISLSDFQLRDVKTVFLAKDRDIPGLIEAISLQRNQHKPVIPTAINMRRSFLEKNLIEILTDNQLKRLTQLWLQMRGPVVLLEMNLVSEVHLSTEQKEQVYVIYRQHFEGIRGSLQEFGRNLVRSIPPNISEKEKKKLMDRLVAKCVNKIKNRDEAICDILSDEQKEQLQGAFGRSLRIAWDPSEFLNQPFCSNAAGGVSVESEEACRMFCYD